MHFIYSSSNFNIAVYFNKNLKNKIDPQLELKLKFIKVS